MRSIFVVSPFDGGWCVKVISTGEVMFFDTGGQAERRARALAGEARSYDGEAEVWIYDRTGRLVGRWIDDQYEIMTDPDDAVAA
ncbi:hypothetical protein B7G68_17790 [Caulobacter segnis]|uniref:DUF2188 domain-containing protein n=2 Tax=Caulobacter segnis TaxID=88688 RepID=D5VN30_CAUST|nr:hypothetical protein [Caulobacter segnis]ADG11903.1 hypothetical protein Cseg_3473 [Caulobacter segnis ATCC 21756]AVQ03532.1 hypothetical protein B7G68_17790 [Caulobacter segnis]